MFIGHFAMALGAKNIKVHVIGFYLRANAETNVACLAKKTGGTGADQSRSRHGPHLGCWFRPRPDEVMTDL